MAPKNERSGEYLLSEERYRLVFRYLFLSLVVKRKCLFPALQLLEPGFSQLYAFLIQLSFAENTDSGIRLLELIVDNDQGLDCATALVLQELQFLVVQGLCIRMTASSFPTENPDVDRQSLVVMLHKLGEIE
ncbi:hypothetical protein HG530_002780 [Fusarium avenaceum]|nr:hypothetical protein HG530_002780 [Fusarium avenaceum]